MRCCSDVEGVQAGFTVFGEVGVGRPEPQAAPALGGRKLKRYRQQQMPDKLTKSTRCWDRHWQAEWACRLWHFLTAGKVVSKQTLAVHPIQIAA